MKSALAIGLLVLAGCTPGKGGGPGSVSFDRPAYFDVETGGPDQLYFVGPGPGGALHTRRDVAGGLAVDSQGEVLFRLSADVLGIRDLTGNLTTIPVVPPPGTLGQYDVIHAELNAAYVVLAVWPHTSNCTFMVYERAKKAWIQGTVPGDCPYIRYVPAKPGPLVVGGSGMPLELTWPGSDTLVQVTALTRFIGTDASGNTYGSNESGSVVRFSQASASGAVNETVLARGPLVASGYTLRFIGIGGDRVFVGSGDNQALDPPLRSYRLDGSDGRDEVTLEKAGDVFGALVTSVSPDGHLVTLTRGAGLKSFGGTNYVYDTRTRGIATLGGGVANIVIWLDPGLELP